MEEKKKRPVGRPRVKDQERKVAHSISFAPDVLKMVNDENPHDRSKAVNALIRKAKRYAPQPSEI